MKSLFRITLGVLVSAFILVIIGMFIWGFPGMGNETTGNKITEKYIDIGDYSIGKQKFLNNICSKDKNLGCLDGQLLGIKIINNNEAYVYIKLNYSVVTGVKSKEIGGYFYNTYKNDKSKFIQNINLIPEYGYINGNILELYSKANFGTLDENKKIIFNELETTPTIIINGVNYTQ